MELYLHAYRQMLRMRRFEEQVHNFFLQGKLHGTTHLYIGEEAVAAGVFAALQTPDSFTSTHRGHGHSIASGADLAPMMAELLGKETGYCKGRGGSMHIGHIAFGNLGANGIVGGGHAIATGAALAKQMQQEPGIVVCFFGDGSTNEGSFHESLNIASLWNLPVLFVCENNGYGLSTPLANAMKIPNLAGRAAPYGIPSNTVDGNKFADVYKASVHARAHVEQKGPFLLVCDTYRIMGHSKSDAGLYRDEQEVMEWKQKDPIAQIQQELFAAGVSAKELETIVAQVETELADAIAFAESSPYPSAETLHQGVYA